MISNQIEKGILHLSENDPKLSAVIAASEKCSLKPRRNYFYSLINAIIGQQLSGFAADSISKRFFIYYNNKPKAGEILLTPDTVLRNLGLSSQKIKYIKDLSLRISSGELNLKKVSALTDNEIINELTRIKGIGVWTVQMFLIFTLNRPDVLPLNDLGIRKGIMRLYNLRKLPDEKKIMTLSRKYNWSPYNSIASWYIWKSLEM
jgi:DNA-3-methyladenine glycosylase II